MIYQVFGRIHATELILVSFRTLSNTNISKINILLLHTGRLTFNPLLRDIIYVDVKIKVCIIIKNIIYNKIFSPFYYIGLSSLFVNVV